MEASRPKNEEDQTFILAKPESPLIRKSELRASSLLLRQELPGEEKVVNITEIKEEPIFKAEAPPAKSSTI